jgi:hypothetical protein
MRGDGVVVVHLRDASQPIGKRRLAAPLRFLRDEISELVPTRVALEQLDGLRRLAAAPWARGKNLINADVGEHLPHPPTEGRFTSGRGTTVRQTLLRGVIGDKRAAAKGD